MDCGFTLRFTLSALVDLKKQLIRHQAEERELNKANQTVNAIDALAKDVLAWLTGINSCRGRPLRGGTQCVERRSSAPSSALHWWKRLLYSRYMEREGC